MTIGSGNPFKDKVELALDIVRKALQIHQGGIELIQADETTGVVTVKLQGACASCAFAELTLHGLVEDTLREQVPEITEVVSSQAQASTV